MSCQEIMEIFKTVGGKMECDYITKKCIITNQIYPTNMSCDITTPNAIRDLEKLISDIMLKPYVKTYHIPAQTWNLPIKRLHQFHIQDTTGITMEFKQINKEWYDLLLCD